MCISGEILIIKTIKSVINVSSLTRSYITILLRKLQQLYIFMRHKCLPIVNFAIITLEYEI